MVILSIPLNKFIKTLWLSETWPFHFWTCSLWIWLSVTKCYYYLRSFVNLGIGTSAFELELELEMELELILQTSLFPVT